MSTRRTTITISDSLYEMAQELMRVRHFDDFSGFLQQLIREEHDRRQTPMTLAESYKPLTSPPQPKTHNPVTYPKAKRASKKVADLHADIVDKAIAASKKHSHQ